MSICADERIVLRRLYSTPKRFYHDFNHAQRVCLDSHRICERLGRDMVALRRASLWHDAIYIVGSNDNEEKSAQALLDFDPKFTRAAELIRLTTINDHLSDDIKFEIDPEAAILLDADLMSLSWDYSCFIDAQKKIGEEAGVGHNIASGHLVFLEKFLSKKRIYRCPGSDTQEIAARENIKQLIEEFQ